MTTDSSSDRQAAALDAWLQAPAGSPPPSDLDGDVVQAVFALRPDLAPAARVTADDILASLTSGPLAARPGASRSTSAGGAEIVPFPSARGGATVTAESESGSVRAPRPRWSRWLGGGVGIAVAAAATLLVVALPLTRSTWEAAAPAPEAASQPTVEAGRYAPAARAPAATPQASVESPAAPPEIATRTAAGPQGAPGGGGAAPGGVLQMQEGAPYRENTLIPEATERVAESARAEDERVAAPAAAAPAAGVAGVSAGEAAPAADETKELADKATDDLTQARDHATGKLVTGSGWRKGVDAPTLARIDEAVKAAEALRVAGNARAAGDRLAPLIAAPTRAGQYVARLAATDYLAAGDVSAAATAAQHGLGLGTVHSPERDALLVVYGDVLRETGDVPAAIDAYEQAR